MVRIHVPRRLQNQKEGVPVTTTPTVSLSMTFAVFGEAGLLVVDFSSSAFLFISATRDDGSLAVHPVKWRVCTYSSSTATVRDRCFPLCNEFFYVVFVEANDAGHLHGTQPAFLRPSINNCAAHRQSCSNFNRSKQLSHLGPHQVVV